MAGTALIHFAAFSSGVKAKRGENNGTYAAVPLFSVPEMRRDGS
jgi:hypothetical protein